MVIFWNEMLWRNSQFVSSTDWDKQPLTWMNKLWPGWDDTLKENGVKDIKRIGKLKCCSGLDVVANFSFSMHHYCILQPQEVKNFLAPEKPLGRSPTVVHTTPKTRLPCFWHTTESREIVQPEQGQKEGVKSEIDFKVWKVFKTQDSKCDKPETVRMNDWKNEF